MNTKFFLMIFAIVTASFFYFTSPASAATYECARPDGTVICTVNTDEEPSVVCNAECKNCNMVCAARQIYGASTTPGVPQSPDKGSQYSGPETSAACRANYANCRKECDSNPTDTKDYDRKACYTSCELTFSGCGTGGR